MELNRFHTSCTSDFSKCRSYKTIKLPIGQKATIACKQQHQNIIALLRETQKAYIILYTTTEAETGPHRRQRTWPYLTPTLTLASQSKEVAEIHNHRTMSIAPQDDSGNNRTPPEGRRGVNPATVGGISERHQTQKKTRNFR